MYKSQWIGWQILFDFIRSSYLFIFIDNDILGDWTSSADTKTTSDGLNLSAVDQSTAEQFDQMFTGGMYVFLYITR